MDAPIADLLRLDSLEKVTLEFTTRCNLKCTYCAVTRPWHKKHDLDLSEFDSLVAEMKALGVRTVQISGGGETTIVKDWDRYLRQLLDNGFQVSIISNLAKPMTDHALHALSLCVEVHTSCDSVDPGLYAAIRRGGDFTLFQNNIRRLREAAIQDGRKPPYLVWNAVANDKVMGGFEAWVRKGIELGIDHFQISEMAKYEDMPGFISLQPVGAMPAATLAAAREDIERARAIAKEHGKWFAVLPAVEEALKGSRRFLRTNTDIEEPDGSKPTLKDSKTVIAEIGEDGVTKEVTAAAPAAKTRNCVMPWTETIVWAKNEIAPCCMYKKVQEFHGRDLASALNGPMFVEVRRGLLTGKLQHSCTICPMFDFVDVEELRQRVAERVGKTYPGVAPAAV